MSDEAAFLRAIQANPSDATAKLVYADWLDDRGEVEKAELIRIEATTGGRYTTMSEEAKRFYELQQRHRVWMELVRGKTSMWDAATLLALGRVQGLLAGYARLNAHASDISYNFVADLRSPLGTVAETAAARYGEGTPVSLMRLEEWEATSERGMHGPDRLKRLETWEAALRRVLNAWLFDELHHLTNSERARLAMLSEDGRGWMVDDVLAHIYGVINPTSGWYAQLTPKGFYALDWTNVVLEAADRVLFLHFSFSD